MIYAQTERLLLRRPRPEDLEPLLVSWSDPTMTRFTGLKDDVHGFLTQLIADMQAKEPGDMEPGGPWYQFIVARVSDGVMVGDLGAGFDLPGERQVELGYRIHPAHQRHGYAREAVAALIDYLIGAHATRRFVARVAIGNSASLGVLRSLGFRQEGHHLGSYLVRDDEPLDEYSFALLDREWHARRS
jgi:RimJ/RimL family protein N-acetyltransferase